MKKIITTWILTSIISFGFFATYTNYGVFGTGANSWSHYGWPSGWLTRNQFQTFAVHPDGEMEQTEYWVKWYVRNWWALAGSIGISITSPAIICIPLILIRKQKT